MLVVVSCFSHMKHTNILSSEPHAARHTPTVGLHLQVEQLIRLSLCWSLLRFSCFQVQVWFSVVAWYQTFFLFLFGLQQLLIHPLTTACRVLVWTPGAAWGSVCCPRTGGPRIEPATWNQDCRAPPLSHGWWHLLWVNFPAVNSQADVWL